MNTLIAALTAGDGQVNWTALAAVVNIPAALWLKGQIDRINKGPRVPLYRLNVQGGR